MTTKRVVYTQANGALAVVIPANKYHQEVADQAARLGVPFSADQLAVVACGKALHFDATGTDPLTCDEADLPTDRTFRNAWERDGVKPVKVNMDKAREIAKRNIRSERSPLLTELDKQFTKAQGQKDAATADAVEAKRQALRDAPADTRLAEAADPGALKVAMEDVIAGMKA